MNSENRATPSSMAGSSKDPSTPTALRYFFPLIHSQEATIWSTDPAFILQNYFHSLRAKSQYPYFKTICYSTVLHEFSKLLLKRVCAKNLVSYGGKTQDTSTPHDTNFSSTQVIELFGKHLQGIFLNPKVWR